MDSLMRWPIFTQCVDILTIFYLTQSRATNTGDAKNGITAHACEHFITLTAMAHSSTALLAFRPSLIVLKIDPRYTLITSSHSNPGRCALHP
jgi:hypothetical protein